MANRYRYGFQWARGIDGTRACPDGERLPIATAFTGSIQGGGAAVGLRPGDVVKKLSTGYLDIAEGSEITSYNPGTVDADTPYGVIVGFEPIYDGSVLQPSNNLVAGGGAYGTNFARQTFARVVPIQAGIWSVAIDTAAAAYDTYAEWLATVGETVDMVNSNLPATDAEPEIDISTKGDASSADQVFKIYGLDESQDNKDYAGASYRLLVIANKYADQAGTAGV